MAGTMTYRCPVCHIEKTSINHWYLVWLTAATGSREFSVREWDEEIAREDPDVLTVCGQAHVHKMLDGFFSAKPVPETTPAEQEPTVGAVPPTPESTPATHPDSATTADLPGTLAGEGVQCQAPPPADQPLAKPLSAGYPLRKVDVPDPEPGTGADRSEALFGQTGAADQAEPV